MRDLARLRNVALNYDSMKSADIIATLKPLAVPGKPYFASAGEFVVERGAQHVARRGAPLHLAVDPREVDGPHDTAVAERVGVPVGVVGVGQVTLGGGVIAHERDLGAVAAERGARQRQPACAELERSLDAVAPRPFVASVVDLVEDHHPLGGDAAHLLGGGPRGELLERRDDPVDVTCDALSRGPVGIELEPEPVGGERPLHLEVARRRHDHEPARRALPGPVRQLGARTGERERRLAGARGRDREEVGVGAGTEQLERCALPRTEGDGAHGVGVAGLGALGVVPAGCSILAGGDRPANLAD